MIVRTLAVIQHTSADYLGLIEDHLEGRRIRFRYYRPFTGGRSLPAPDDVSGGLVLLVYPTHATENGTRTKVVRGVGDELLGGHAKSPVMKDGR